MCLNEPCSKLRGNKLALSPLLFNITVKYAIRKVRENQEEMEFSGGDEKCIRKIGTTIQEQLTT